MYTNVQIDAETVRVLNDAAMGRGEQPRALCAYQICDSFDDAMARYFIERGGVGGENGKKDDEGPAFTQIVQHSLRRLANKTDLFYMDTRGLVFTIKGHEGIHPAFPVMAVYQIKAS